MLVVLVLHFNPNHVISLPAKTRQNELYIVV